MAADPVAPVRRRIKAVWFAPLFAAIAMVSWVFASPIGASPDDDYHLASIWCANGPRAGLCLDDPNDPQSRLVPRDLTNAPCYVADVNASAGCQDWAEDPPADHATNHGNWIGAYPPVYYAFMNIFVSHDIQASALAMRLFNTALFLAMTVALALLLPRRLATPLVVGWTITMVPLSIFLITSNNPGSWALIGVGNSWLAALGWYSASGRRAWALGALTFINVLIAAGARTDAAIYCIIGLGIASVLAFEKTRAYARKLILPLALACMALPFYFTSGYAAVAEGGLTGGIADPASRDQMAVFAYNVISIPRLWTGIFGSWGNGWRMEEWPGYFTVEFATLAVFIGLASLGLRRMFWQKSAMAVALVATLYLLPLYILTVGLSVVSENVQPRYILPLVVVLGGLLVLTRSSQPLRVGRWHIIPAIILLSVAQSLALHGNLRRYVTGFDAEHARLGSGAEWWWSFLPVGPDAVWVIGSLAFAVTVTLLGRHWLLISRTQPAIA